MSKDPTQLESYLSLRRALSDLRDDPSAVMALLSSVPDSGIAWVETAHFELRRALVEGQLAEAETVGELISVVLRAQEHGPEDELATWRIHDESLRCLTQGIDSILSGDNRAGIERLSWLSEAVYSSESLRWVAWIWTARAAAADGDLVLAERSATEALEIGGGLDARARAVTLHTTSGIKFQRGELDVALELMAEAIGTFDEAEDWRGRALASLTLARMMVGVGRIEEGLRVADRVHRTMPDWVEPVIFMSERALERGQIEQAEELIRPFCDPTPRSPEVEQQRHLLDAVRKKEVPRELVADYLRLKEKPASEEVVAALEKLAAQHPKFVLGRELLAWNLARLGRDEEAAQHFEALASSALNPDVQTSVLLGLGWLASRKFVNRPSGARVRATASAAARPIETCGGDQDQVDDVPIIVETEASADITQALLGAADGKFSGAGAGGDAPPAASSAIVELLDPQGLIDGEEPVRLERRKNGEAAPAEGGPPPPPQQKGERRPPGEEVRPVPARAVTLRIEPGKLEDAVAAAAADGPPRRSIDTQEIKIPPREMAAADGLNISGSAYASKAAFTGSLQLLAVPDLLEFLRNSRRTGTLVITSEEGIGAIHMRRGKLTGAASPACTNLGAMLQQRGAVTPEQIESATGLQQAEGRSRLLGEILVEQGWLEREVLEDVLAEQVRRAIGEMVGWTFGRFAFEPDKRDQSELEGETAIELDTQQVLLDVLRELDEQRAR